MPTYYSPLHRLLRIQASPVDEPMPIVIAYISLGIILAVGVAATGIWGDHAHAYASVCGCSKCRWFMRSGGLIVLCGTCFAFRSGAVLIKSYFGPNDRPLMGTNPNPSWYYGAAALALIAVGTLVWAFGDLI